MEPKSEEDTVLVGVDKEELHKKEKSQYIVCFVKECRTPLRGSRLSPVAPGRGSKPGQGSVTKTKSVRRRWRNERGPS